MLRPREPRRLLTNSGCYLRHAAFTAYRWCGACATNSCNSSRVRSGLSTKGWRAAAPMQLEAAQLPSAARFASTNAVHFLPRRSALRVWIRGRALGSCSIMMDVILPFVADSAVSSAAQHSLSRFAYKPLAVQTSYSYECRCFGPYVSLYASNHQSRTSGWNSAGSRHAWRRCRLICPGTGGRAGVAQSAAGEG